tara:strand:- start:837 stop:1019 length:183 start_codon:yes stop_codon:yes gene_type:complete
MHRLWSLLQSENEEQHLPRNPKIKLTAAYRNADLVAELQGREALKACVSPPKHLAVVGTR